MTFSFVLGCWNLQLPWREVIPLAPGGGYEFINKHRPLRSWLIISVYDRPPPSKFRLLYGHDCEESLSLREVCFSTLTTEDGHRDVHNRPNLSVLNLAQLLRFKLLSDTCLLRSWGGSSSLIFCFFLSVTSGAHQLQRWRAELLQGETY